MLIKGEDVSFILALAKETLLVSVTHGNLILVHNWEALKLIQEADPRNNEKNWLALLPGFDLNSFPFVVSSGKLSYNLINVKSEYMAPLIQGSGNNGTVERPAFFLERDNSNLDMFFVTTGLIEDSHYELNMHCMTFKEDFTQTLNEYGRLPFVSNSDSLAMANNYHQQ